MMSWSTRRRIIYFGSFSIFIILIVFSVFYFYFYKAPTCSDGKQNQSEEGVDCGGSCKIVCNFQTVKPLVLWSRYFKVVDGVYNAIALIENPNINVEAYGVPYMFKLFDKDGILIAERNGKIDILPRTIVPIFEPTIKTGNRVPARNPYFEFIENAQWVKTNKVQPDLSIKNKILTSKNGNSRLEAVVINNSVKTVKNIELTAIISEQNGNAIAVSQTYLNSLNKNSSKTIVFTWPKEFSSEAFKIDIIPLVKSE